MTEHENSEPRLPPVKPRIRWPSLLAIFAGALALWLVAGYALTRYADETEDYRAERQFIIIRDQLATTRDGRSFLQPEPYATEVRDLSRAYGVAVSVRPARQEQRHTLRIRAVSNQHLIASTWLLPPSGGTSSTQGFVLSVVSPRREYRAAQMASLLLGVVLLGGALGLSTLKIRRMAREADARVLAVIERMKGLEDEASEAMAQAERHIVDKDQTYRLMALTASDVLYAMYPRDGRIDWFGQIDQMLGYANGSFPRTIDAWADSIHPDETEDVIAQYSKACLTGEPFSAEYRMRHRNGSYRHWVHRGRAMFEKANGHGQKKLNRLIGSCSDITERKRAEMALRESEEKLKSILETVADAIVLCDCNGTLTYANPAAEAIFGAPNRELVDSFYGDERWNITTPDDLPVPPEELPPLVVRETKESVHAYEHKFSHPLGKSIIVSANATPLHDEDGGIAGSVISLTDITTRKEIEQNLTFRAFHDNLTKLPNRLLFRERLQHALAASKRQETMVAVAFIDLDNFKRINDTLGHAAGDELLIVTGQRLLQCIRTGDTAARLAGDEFALLLDNIVDVDQTIAIANRLLEVMSRPVLLDGHTIYAPPSIGIAFGDHRDETEALLHRADQAMYSAKRNGKGRYEIEGCEPMDMTLRFDAVALPPRKRQAPSAPPEAMPESLKNDEALDDDPLNS